MINESLNLQMIPRDLNFQQILKRYINSNYLF